MNFLKIHCIALFCLFSAAVVAQTASPSGSPTPAQSNAAPIPGKTTTSAATPTQPAQPPGSLISENEPVLTINGVCEISTSGTAKAAHATTGTKTGAAATHTATSSSSSECKTQITRAEFEKLMKTVAPGAPAQARRQIASRYAQFLTAANEGVKLGVDKDPDFNEQLALMRLQLLAQDAERKLQTQASNVSESELRTYYDQNQSAFEEVTLTRLYVPRPVANPKDATPAPDAKAIADNARQQLLIGGDPDKIEKGIYDQLKNTTQPPSAKFGTRRRGSMPAAQEQKIFEMKTGDISEVIADPSGYVIYRVDEKKQLPFEDAKEDVKQRISRQRIADAREQITNASKVDYNDAYFGPETPAPRPGGLPPVSRPPAGVGAPPATPPTQTQTNPPANPK